MPTLLLAEGDIVDLGIGDTVPCEGVLLTESEGSATVDSDGMPLAPSAILTAAHIALLEAQGNNSHPVKRAGRYAFALRATPLRQFLFDALTYRGKPAPTFVGQARVLSAHHAYYIIPAALIISLVIVIVRYIVEYVAPNANREVGVELLLSYPAAVVLPLLPFQYALLALLARTYTAAYMHELYTALMQSTTEYEDAEEIDEFDVEAPPPVKSVSVSAWRVARRMAQLCVTVDAVHLSRSTQLLQVLATVTVISFPDREGTIATAFPSVEQLYLPIPSHGTADVPSAAITRLDVAEEAAPLSQPSAVFFEDEGWDNLLSLLKPIGLCALLNTRCRDRHHHQHYYQHDTSDRERAMVLRAPHRRLDGTIRLGRVSCVQQMCLCRLARAIGFAPNSEAAYRQINKVTVFAPNHPASSLGIRGRRDLAPFSLVATVCASNTASPSSAQDQSSIGQLVSDGDPVLVIDHCTDYWDGSEVHPLPDDLVAAFMDLHFSSQLHDMQCIAFAYRPIVIQPSSHQSTSSPGISRLDYVELSHSSIQTTTDNDASPDAIIPATPVPVVETQSTANISLGEQAAIIRRHLRNSSQNTPQHPLAESASVPLSENGEISAAALSNQIFLGMAAVCHQPQVDVVDFIEDLGLAGIRFVYFSPGSEKETKAFGERLGLETDWNACILLSSAHDEDGDGAAPGYMDHHDIKAQLPRGVDEIRQHLRDVDDIPLHVSLFAESRPVDVQETIRIFQENGDVVLCVGSVMRATNLVTFATADIAVAMEPCRTELSVYTSKGMQSTKQKLRQIQQKERRPPTLLEAAAALVGLPCSLLLPPDASLYNITQLIREARRLSAALAMSITFLVGCGMCVCISQILSLAMCLPPVLPGYVAMWMLWIALPLLAAAPLATHHAEDIMKTLPFKNSSHLVDIWRFTVYGLLRFGIVAIIQPVVFLLALTACLGKSTTPIDAFRFTLRSDTLSWTRPQQDAVLAAQLFTSVGLLIHLTVVSISFLSRTQSIHQALLSLPHNKAWRIGAPIAIGLHVGFVSIVLATACETMSALSLGSIPWYVYLLVIVWIIPVVGVQEMVVKHDRHLFTRFQKLSRLEFDVRLGLHSPI
ncbi:hypothetical protein GQ42DRAFT_152597 [Ramicandelaber brevisporus]|nr:hypothetical protein GQ42DRAFT_152597 [Ramicandelaber brevisporus]